MRFSLFALALLVLAGCRTESTDPAPEADAPAETAEAVATEAPAPEASDTEAAPAEATPGDLQPGVTAPAFTLTGTDGTDYTLADLRGKTVVLEWLNYDCPYVAKQYSTGNMTALQEGYTAGDDVVWLSIVSSAPGEQGYFEAEVMNERTEIEGGQQTAVLMDPTGEVGRLYGAKTTPHMYVISPEGTLVYNGAIDDHRVTSPDGLDQATTYFVNAMEALAAGQPAD
ncbi:MAG: redoxin family protein, partial [Bacteroidota bacterium]